jgi:hypothetical protein
MVSGNTLMGTWAEDSIAGPFQFTMSDDCKSFSGIFTTYGNSTPARSWTGARVGEAHFNGNDGDPYIQNRKPKKG